MLIDFEAKQTFNQTLDLEDPGNSCIRCENEQFVQWYLITKSIRGHTHYLEFGPVLPDLTGLPPNFSCYYGQFNYNEKKIYGLISKFLNDPKKEVSSAIVDLEDNALDDFQDVATLFKNLS